MRILTLLSRGMTYIIKGNTLRIFQFSVDNTCYGRLTSDSKIKIDYYNYIEMKTPPIEYKNDETQLSELDRVMNEDNIIKHTYTDEVDDEDFYTDLIAKSINENF